MALEAGKKTVARSCRESRIDNVELSQRMQKHRAALQESAAKVYTRSRLGRERIGWMGLRISGANGKWEETLW